MQSEEVEGSNIFPFPIGFVAKKGSSNGQKALVRPAISNRVESDNVEFQS